MLEPMLMEATRGQELLQLMGEYISEDLPGQLATLSVGLFLSIGALLMLLAAVGLMRLPDLPTRMHASTKAGSLGAAMIMVAVAIHMPDAGVFARVLAVVAFLLLTAPVAAHIIGRAGYYVGVPLWSGTVIDELADQYDFETHTLSSGGYETRDWGGSEEVADEAGADFDEKAGPKSRRVRFPEEFETTEEPMDGLVEEESEFDESLGEDSRVDDDPLSGETDDEEEDRLETAEVEKEQDSDDDGPEEEEKADVSSDEGDELKKKVDKTAVAEGAE